MACNKNTSELTTQKTEEISEIKALAAKNFGEDYILTYNKTKDHVLVSRSYTVRKTDPYKTLRIEILKVNPLESIFTDAIRGGEAVWQADHVLKVTGMKGIPNNEKPGNNGPGYSYDVLKKRKFTGGFFNAKN